MSPNASSSAPRSSWRSWRSSLSQRKAQRVLMLTENPVLKLLSFLHSSPEEGITEGYCREYPDIKVIVQGTDIREMNKLLRAEVEKRLQSGKLPHFAGTGSEVIALVGPGKGKDSVSLMLDESWCLLPDEQLAKEAARAAARWIHQAGSKCYVGPKPQNCSSKDLIRLICEKVKEARQHYAKCKSAWEERLKTALEKLEAAKASDAQIKHMISRLIGEAQRYIVDGGRLKELGRTKPPGTTLAEKWHRYTFEQFNERALTQIIHREETKDENGHVIKSRNWVENSGGGEVPAAAEQVHYLLQGISREAQKGDESGMYWLYQLAMFATAEFWHAVETQKDAAKKLSVQWAHIPVHWCDDPKLHKAILKRIRGLQMPKPPSVSGKIKPDSPHQIAISRTQTALNFLLRSPPIFLPPTPDGSRSDFLDDYLPEWLKKAQILAWSKSTDLSEAAEVLWDVYVAAMTATPESPWRRESRPRKAKENFIKAVLAHRPKTS